MRSGPANQHFVPKCYLSNFVDPNTPANHEPYVWVFERSKRKGKKRAPHNIFTEKHLYTINFKDGTQSFKIEQKLSEIEGKFAYIFKTKIKNKKPLSVREHVYLCIFVAAQLQRTLRRKETFEKFIQELIDHSRQLALVHGITDSKEIERLENYKNNAHKIQLVDGIPFLTNILLEMNIAFLCSKNINKHWFITSDEPCVLFNPDLQWQRFYGPGFAQKNIQLTLPLSPEITVMFTWHNFHGYSYLDGGRIEDMNRMTRIYTNKEFVSSQPKTKLIWYSPVPFDMFFFFKIIKKESATFLERIYHRFKYRKIYAR